MRRSTRMMYTGFTAILLCAVFLTSPAAKDKDKAKSSQAALDAQPDPVWPPPPDPPRVKWVRFIRDEYDVGAVKKSRFLDALAGKSQEVFELKRPMAVTADADGTVYVLDFLAGILKLDMKNHKVVNLSQSSGMGTQNPTGVTVDSRFLYVADSKRNAVLVLDRDGRIVRQIMDPKLLSWPVGLALDEKSGLLFVANSHANNILVFDTNTFRLVRTIGKRGEGPGQFNYPTFLTTLPGERVAVVDSMNFRVQILRYDGKPLKSFGKLGDKPGELFRPKGIAADSDGNLYVADASFQNIQAFNQEGQLLGVIGEGGNLKGQFSMPLGLSCVNDTLYVADQFNGRIQVLQYIPERKGGEAAKK